MKRPLRCLPIWIALFLAILSACNYVPKGATLFAIDSTTREYDRADLAYPPSEGEKRLPMRLRWVNTNAWLSSGTLAPGKYILTARTYDGGFYSHEVDVKPEQNRYLLPGQSQSSIKLAVGPHVSGSIQLNTLTEPLRELIVIFIGQDVTVRRTNPKDGYFSVDAPTKGKYTVEIHAPGAVPKSFYKPNVDVSADVDLGKIDLK